jgi:hypothetical protein
MPDSTKTSNDESEQTDQQKEVQREPSRPLSFSEFAEVLKRGEVNLDVPMQIRRRKKA